MAAPMQKGKKFKPKNRKTKTFLEFDEKARSEYLRGFQKRKNERKKQAREKHDRRILEERKELLKQARDSKKSHLRQEAAVIPEIKHLVDPEVFDLPEHTVTIANIGDVDFVGKTGLRLGQNTGNKIPQNGIDSDDGDDVITSEKSSEASKPVKNKSLRQQLAACSNQLSAQKTKTKKLKRKQLMRQKLNAKKKGKKKGKK